MANENQLIISVSAETIELVKALATAQNGLQDFAKEGKTTAATLTSALSAINKESKNTFDVTALAAYNKSAQELKGTLKDIRTVGLAPADTSAEDEAKRLADAKAKLEAQAKKARIALIGLNQVVRDLPFGFIAISNNLPVLFDQFTALRTETGSSKAAFKQLTESILGAGGITLAFSLLTAGITALVDKYGSLKVAIQSLIITNKDFLQSIVEQNKELDQFIKKQNTIAQISARSISGTQAEISEARKLVGIISDLNNSQQQRASALDRLKQISSESFGALTIENLTVKQLNESYKTFQTLISKTQERDKLIKSINDTSEKTQILKEQISGTNAIIAQLRAEQNKLSNSNANSAEQAVANANRIAFLGNEISVFTQKNKEAQNRLDLLNQQLFNYDNQLGNVTKTITSLGIVTGKEAKNSDAVNAAIESQSISLERKIKLLKDSLRYIAVESKEYEDTAIKIVELEGQIKKLKETSAQVKLQIDIDTGINIQQVKKDIRDKIIKTGGVEVLQREFSQVELNLPVQITTDSKKGISGKYTVAEQIKQFNAKLATTPLTVPLSITKKEKEIKKLTEDFDRANKKIKEDQKNQLKEIGDLLSNVLNNGIKIFQQGIADGVDNTKALKAALKEVGKELTKIIVKLAAIEVIKLIATAISGNKETGQAVGKIASQVLGVPNLNFGKKQLAPVRGIDIGPGGLAIGGRVTFVQRGPDLVGVLQQANGRINRVG